MVGASFDLNSGDVGLILVERNPALFELLVLDNGREDLIFFIN